MKIEDYEDKDFIRIENGSIIWQGYFYDTEGWHLLEYCGFETTIRDFINKYNRSPVGAYEAEGTCYPQYIRDESEGFDAKGLFADWMEDTKPIKAEDISEDTPNGFYVIV